MNANTKSLGSGPRLADTFLRSLGLIFAIAFVSLTVQVDELISSQGLLPIEPFLEQLSSNSSKEHYWKFPTLFWLGADDIWINHLSWVGVVFALAATAGIYPRVFLSLCTLLYLSYATACRDFLYFQWDSLLIECGFLAIFLPRDRRADWIHFLFRVLLFKLYLESGVAKWESHLHDWQDGSAMTFYYQTAPIPTWLSWHFHHLPEGWHHFESWSTLFLELVVPFFIFGGRTLRLTAFVLLTGFQLLNIATANYGLFSYQALILHLFLLDDWDLRFLPRLLVRPMPPPPLPVIGHRWDKLLLVSALCTVYIGISTAEGIVRFARTDHPEYHNTFEMLRGHTAALLEPIQPYYRPFRVINTYHLFGHITRQRVEPQFEVFKDDVWHELDMKYKAGRLDRPPPFVAPHQPRVDFRLWFYGLSHRRGRPAYVRAITKKLCSQATELQDLFETPLEDKYNGVRIRFWTYTYTSPAQRSETGNWWLRTETAKPLTYPCY